MVEKVLIRDICCSEFDVDFESQDGMYEGVARVAYVTSHSFFENKSFLIRKQIKFDLNWHRNLSKGQNIIKQENIRQV